MTIKYGVAYTYHMAGARPEAIDKMRFETYDEAANYAHTVDDECLPTIYLLLDNKYAFNCERSAVGNFPYCIKHYQTIPHGSIETFIWWKDFLENPYNFIQYAEGTI